MIKTVHTHTSSNDEIVRRSPYSIAREVFRLRYVEALRLIFKQSLPVDPHAFIESKRKELWTASLIVDGEYFSLARLGKNPFLVYREVGDILES
jgi:hypothetical protein